MNDETITVKGELHYLWPHRYHNGNSVKCDECRYFAEDLKSRSGFAHIKTGECHSEAYRADRGYTHRKNGWDRTDTISGCHWWFPAEKVAGENETLFEEK